MLPAAGPDSDVFREVVRLGETLRALDPLVGARQRPARAAILFDWDSWWASEQDSHPSDRLRYRAEALDWYSAFLSAGVRVDVLPAGAPLTGYDLVVAPILYVMPGDLAATLTGYVAGGGHLVTTYFSGIVDENDHVWLGGYPGALRELLGIRVEEFSPLLDDEGVDLENGTTGTLWSERIDITGDEVEVVLRSKAGDAVVTRRAVGTGSAAYVSTRLGPAGLAPLLAELLDRAGVRADLPAALGGRVELGIRRGDGAEFWFLINRTASPVEVPDVDGEVLHGERVPGPGQPVLLGPRGVAVLRRSGRAAVDEAERGGR